jgi:hypothetical protein
MNNSGNLMFIVLYFIPRKNISNTSTSTGAPAAFALADGFHVDKNGHATKPTPTAPTTLVALVRKRLFLRSKNIRRN